MKNFSITPTDENALDLLAKNPINRNASVTRFIKLIDSVEGNCSIALNGEWGSGKTMFVKQVKLVMDFNNPHSKLSERESLSSRVEFLSDTSCYASYSTVYYDAWENDKHDDPLLSLIYAAISSNQSKFDITNNRSLVGVLGALVDVVSERSISDILRQAKGDDPLKLIKEKNDINTLVRQFLDALILEKGNRLVIFIDELDRCRPNYAIQLLERIKHYFDDERITFIFSVNLSQLQHTIKTYYGPSFDATRYLDKFFDLRVAMPPVDYNRFLDYKFSFVKSGGMYNEMCIHVIQYFSFSLRETERYLQIVKIAGHNASNPPHFWDGTALYFATVHFVPILIGLSMTDLESYKRFILGQKEDILYGLLDGMGDYMLFDLLDISYRNTEPGTDIVEEAKNKIMEIYRTLFSPNGFNFEKRKQIGRMTFSESTHNGLMEIVSLLAPNANYEIEI